MAEEDRLWVIGHDGERGVLHGNPHTHPGRFSVLWESTGETHATSLSDLADMSVESRAWLEGFLCGNEPTVWEVLGLASEAEPTDEQWKLWNRKLADFRRTGTMRLPIHGLEAGDELFPALFVTGAPGSGKTALIKEISEVLYRADQSHAVVDLDELCRGVFPASAVDFGLDLAIENLVAVWSNFKRRGARRLVAARIVQSADDLVRIRAALSDCELTICRLTVAPAVLESRIRHREAGSSAAFLTSVAGALAQTIDAIEFPMVAVDNGPDASITELANRVLEGAGWPTHS